MKPSVTVFVPCYNEENTIYGLLDSLSKQTYPLNKLEVLIIDGHSTDNTLNQIDQFKNHHSELPIRVINNPHRQIPHALNIGCNSASGEILLRMDAHSIPSENYVELCVEGLILKKGDNIGGKWKIVPSKSSGVAKAIAIAAAHPLGSGGASYRSGNDAKHVDTVPFGCFFRITYRKVGPFDESLLANEDYEWNYRLIESGGKIWFDPNIVCNYLARADLPSLAKQYRNYGYWKRQMLSKYPSSLRLRQALPVLLVLMLSLALLLLAIGVITSSTFLTWAGVMMILSHPFLIIISFIKERTGITLLNFSLVVASLMTIHISWGYGFLWRSLKFLVKKNS
ncbi:MAG: glycosyltransferase family 2 protein [Opitutales bacterium]|nr:glycosyltransferase family 2 protein [Opitutales bacterium]